MMRDIRLKHQAILEEILLNLKTVRRKRIAVIL